MSVCASCFDTYFWRGVLLWKGPICKANLQAGCGVVRHGAGRVAMPRSRIAGWGLQGVQTIQHAHPVI